MGKGNIMWYKIEYRANGFVSKIKDKQEFRKVTIKEEKCLA